MEYKISLSDDRKYILVLVSGSVNRLNTMEYVIESHKLGLKEGIKSFLIDLRNARNVDSIGNNYNFVNEDLQSESLVDKSAKIALLVEKNDHSHDFIETVAINSGNVLRLFRDEKEALQYLDVK